MLMWDFLQRNLMRATLTHNRSMKLLVYGSAIANDMVEALIAGLDPSCWDVKLHADVFVRSSQGQRIVRRRIMAFSPLSLQPPPNSVLCS